jgi:hypothetical protein
MHLKSDTHNLYVVDEEVELTHVLLIFILVISAVAIVVLLQVMDTKEE